MDDEAMRKEIRRGDLRFARLSHQGGVRATPLHRFGECPQRKVGSELNLQVGRSLLTNFSIIHGAAFLLVVCVQSAFYRKLSKGCRTFFVVF